VVLGHRKNLILQAIVEDYVETADPIGSEWLAAHHDFGCKPATLRNEMAEMSDLGYLRQPHTSAGRIPSDRGYRYYVDRLMTEPSDGPATKLFARQPAATPVEEIVQETCRVLSEMTSYPSVATPPALRETSLRRMFVAPASGRHLLLVMLLSNGQVENRVLELQWAPDSRSLERIGNFLNAQLANQELSRIAQGASPSIPQELWSERAIITKCVAAVKQAAKSLAEERVYVEGTSHFLRHPEFQDINRLEAVLSVLEQSSLLFEALSRALLDSEVKVLIGTEHAMPQMEDCSLITCGYRIRNRVSGYIGVVGPTRMQYARAVGAVGLMARSLSSVLTRASLE
jgi:heat-inducible transcriptional repressor